MKHTVFSAALKTLGMSQPQFAAAFNEATGRAHVRQHVNAWVKGRRPIPDAVAMFVQYRLATMPKPQAPAKVKIKPESRRKPLRKRA